MSAVHTHPILSNSDNEVRPTDDRRTVEFWRKHGELHESAPEGFTLILDKMIRAVLVSRPLRLRQFFAEFLEAELVCESLRRLQYDRRRRVRSEDYKPGKLRQGY